MKKGLAILLCMAMLCGLGAGALAAYTPGVYEAEAKGFGGNMKVAVTVDGDAITDVKVLEHLETAGISDPAFNKIPEAIVAGQTLAVDTVAGCTFTSKAILEAAELALTAAGADIEALKTASSEEMVKEDKDIEADVVVVGGGIAGLSAAITAVDNGAKVLLIDKMPILGGTTLVAGGGVAAVGSELYKGKGADDTIAGALEYWKKAMAYGGAESPYPDYERLEDVLAETGKSIDFLSENGVAFGDMPGQMEGYAFAFATGGGSALIASLEASARAKGIEIMTECKATELVVEDGVVIGVKAETADANLTIIAGSVVLCTGGFSQNPEMVAQLSPEIVNVVPTSAISHTGDGIRMALDAGAGTFEEFFSAIAAVGLKQSFKASVENASALRTGPQLGVNALGERFASEVAAGYSALTYLMIDDGNFPFRYIFDSADEAKIAALDAGVELGEVVKAETIEELAAAMNVPADTLKATFENYNAMCAAGEDKDFGKAAENMIALEKAPFYAVTFYPETFGSTGGVLTDNQGRVTKQDGTVIPGLYAAGEMSNRYFYNKNYIGGASLGLYSTMGRRAGAAAVNDK